MKTLSAILAISASATAAQADCPSTPPDASKFPTSAEDQEVDARWLEKNLAGRKIIYDGGDTEHYKPDGSYSFRSNGRSYQAPGYRFYENGIRCIDYQSPRFDYYVVNNKRLIVINQQGGRFVGRLRE